MLLQVSQKDSCLTAGPTHGLEMRCKLRSQLKVILALFVAVLAFSFVSFAQGDNAQGDEGAHAQRGRRNRDADTSSPTANLPFDPHDFSGIWIGHGKAMDTLSNNPPPMTAWAKARYDAAKPGIGPRAQPLGNDPMMSCDPVGFPRIAFKNAYPMEFVQTKDRLIQFFDYFYTYRTIYLDGRQLPEHPEPTWYGYSVGHWDGNTLIVESTGFNDKSWLDSDAHPHSDQMRIEERFQRVDHDTVKTTMTLTDPKAYTEPWVSEVKTWKLSPKEVMREDLCVPSEEEAYKEEMRVPAAEKK